MDGFDMVLQFLPLIMFGILGLFLVFGMLFGLGRGFKRSWIRLATVFGFLLVAFLLTPALANLVYNLPINIFGHTPKGWVDELVIMLQNSEAGFLAPVLPYIEEFAIGVVFALINIILFLILYLIVKPLSWILYSILVHCFAPKKDKDGNKLPKRKGLGLLIGAVQGLVLFVFFMLPFNCVISMNSQIASYQALGGIQVSQASEASQVQNTCQKIDQSLAGYQGVLRYTGLEAVSNWAFKYQTTVKVGDTQVDMSNDIVNGVELVIDVQEFTPVFQKLSDSNQSVMVNLGSLKPQDFQAGRYIVNKFFDLQLLRVGDLLLNNLDTIMCTSASGNGEILDGTQSCGVDVYDDSIYGKLAQNNANANDINNRGQYITGLRAMTNYVGEKSMKILRDDLNQMITMVEDLSTLQIAYGEQASILSTMGRADNQNSDFFGIMLEPLCANDKFKSGTLVLDVFFKDIRELSLFTMISQKDAEKFITHSNFFDHVDDGSLPGLQTFVRDFTGSFFGKRSTETLDRLQTASAKVLRMAYDFGDMPQELDNIINNELLVKYPESSRDELMPRAFVKYLAHLTDDEIDELAEGMHAMVFTFPEVPSFAKNVIGSWGMSEFNQIFLTLLDTDDVASWKSTLHGMVGMFNVLDEVGELLTEITSIDFNDPDATKQLVNKLIGDAENPGVDAGKMADTVYALLQVPEISDNVDDMLQSIANEYQDDPAVASDITELRQFLTDYDSEAAKTPEQIATEQEKLRDIFANLWAGIGA